MAAAMAVSVAAAVVGDDQGNPDSPRPSDSPIIIPNRVFVGGFPQHTTEQELKSHFEQYGVVRDVKIIHNSPGAKNSKYSYGFITFESDGVAQQLIERGKALGTKAFEFRGRYLNVNEAVKKPPLNRIVPLDAVPPTGVVLRDIHGNLFTIKDGMAVFADAQYAISQPQPVQPTVPLFVQQHPIYVTTAPPAPIRYAHQSITPYAIQQSPASAPILQQPNSGTPQSLARAHFMFPPRDQPFSGNQLTQLPPTPVASPINHDSSPPKNMTTGVNGVNPAITNLTTPFPTIIGANNQVLNSSQYRWTPTAVPGQITQWVCPQNYHPAIVHETGHPYSPLHPIQGPPPPLPVSGLQAGPPNQPVPIQSQMPPPPQNPMGNGIGIGYYPAEMGDYNYSAMDSFHDMNSIPMDRRQMQSQYRMENCPPIQE